MVLISAQNPRHHSEPVTKEEIEAKLTEVKLAEEALQKDFKVKDSILSIDIQSLFFAFLNRSRFAYTLRDMVEYLLRCLCIRSARANKREIGDKKHFLFEKAEEKFANELDVVRIVKTLRKFKMLA